MSSEKKNYTPFKVSKKGERGPCRGHVGPAYLGTLPTTGPTQQLGVHFPADMKTTTDL